MRSSPDPLPLRDSSRSLSREQLTPRSSNTVFSLTHQDAVWSAHPVPGRCEFYWRAILLVSSGGSVLLCGMVLSGLYFAGVSTTATNVLGPALLSAGLMVLVVGVVLLPITLQMKERGADRRPASVYRPQIHL